MQGQDKFADFDLYQELVEAIYDASLDPTLWDAFIEKVAKATNAEMALLWFRDGRETSNEDSFHGYNLDPSWVKPYDEHYISLDPMAQTLMKASTPAEQFICSQDLISDQEMVKTEFYNDLLAPQKKAHCAASLVAKIDENFLYFGSMREKKAGNYERHDIALLQSLVPHLQRAYAITRKLRTLHNKLNTTEDMIDRLNVAVILVDASGKPINSNRKAKELLKDNDGLITRDGKLTTSIAEETSGLTKLINNASNPLTLPSDQVGAMKIIRKPPKEPLTVMVTPTRKRKKTTVFDPPSATAAIFIAEKEQQPELSETVLASIYDLSPAESRLAMELANGLSIDQIASKHHISPNTLRVQARSIFKKTGTSRQIDLIKLILSGPAIFSPSSYEQRD